MCVCPPYACVSTYTMMLGGQRTTDGNGFSSSTSGFWTRSANLVASKSHFFGLDSNTLKLTAAYLK